jgi:hypothetical protein
MIASEFRSRARPFKPKNRRPDTQLATASFIIHDLSWQAAKDLRAIVRSARFPGSVARFTCAKGYSNAGQIADATFKRAPRSGWMLPAAFIL